MLMKEKIFALLCSIIIYFFPSCSWAANNASNYVEVGPSGVGTLYVDLSAVQTLRKDGNFFLITAVEERYNDPEFLADIRSGEGLENAAGMLTLYVFDNRGSQYSIAKQYIFDKDNNVCLDLASNMNMQNIGNNKDLLKIYEISLKHIETKQKSSKGWIK